MKTQEQMPIGKRSHGVYRRDAFICLFCGTQYWTKKEADKCAAHGFKPTLKVGDIVTPGPHYGWYNGDEKWLTGEMEIDRGTRLLGFYYVVTHIDSDDFNRSLEPAALHRPRYHAFTRALIVDGDHFSYAEGERDDSDFAVGGYTFDSGHWRLRPVPNIALADLPGAQELVNLAPRARRLL
jgi:hypothetical protein